MNLEKPEIRSILSGIYQEACLLEDCNMRELAQVLEEIADTLYQQPTIAAWQKIKLDRKRFDRQPYLECIVQFKAQAITALKQKITAHIRRLTKKSKKQAFDQWLQEYAEALAYWQGDIYGELCTTPFDFTVQGKKQVQHYALLNQLILDDKWPETLGYFQELAENPALSVFQQSTFAVYAGQVMMYQLSYPDKAKVLFDQARSIDPGNPKTERASGEYDLVMKDVEKARTHFLNAISMDAHDIENYAYMGDTYLEEKKLDASEQWYNDALNINFLDTLPYSRLILLAGEKEDIADHKDYIDALLDKAALLEKNRENENLLYNLHRDAGFAFSKQQQYGQSAVYYKKAIKLKPDYSAAMIDLAYILAYDKKYKEAEKWFKKSIKAGVEGHDFASYWGLGWLFEQTGNIDHAIEAYKKCDGLRQFGNDRVNNILGILNYNKGLYPDAVMLYKKAIAENPVEPVYFDNLKNALEKIGDQNELEAFYEKLAATFPERCDYLNQVGVFYHNKGEYEKAIEYYSRALDLKSDRAIYWENRALANELLGKYDNAEADYTKALELGENANLLNSIGVVKFRQSDYNGALDYFNKAIKLKKDDPIYYENIGLAHENTGDFEAAEKDYQKALKVSNEDARFLNRLGLYYHNRKMYDKSLEWYTKAAEKDPENTTYTQNIAVAYENLGQYDKAEILYKKLLTKDKDNLALHIRLLTAQYFQKKYAEVLMSVGRLLLKHPENLELYTIQGMAYEQEYLYKDALNAYKQVLKTEPSSEYFNNRAGIMHYYLATPADLKAALAYYQKAIDLNPNAGIYHKNMALVYQSLGDEPAAAKALAKAGEIEGGNVVNKR